VRAFFIDRKVGHPTIRNEQEKDMNVFEPLLTTQQAATLLAVHPKTLQKLARDEKLPGIRIGDLWRFRASDLDAWLRKEPN
jgi:excisionase family DNA binding protein